MQKTVKQIRFLSLVLALTISSSLFTACNNEGEKPESTTDSVTTTAPATVDTMQPVDSSATTRPDGGTTGGATAPAGNK